MGCTQSKKQLINIKKQEEFEESRVSFIDDLPQQLLNGDTFIPVNVYNGLFSTKYPKWLIQDISPRQFIEVINKLNNLNKRYHSIWSNHKHAKKSHSHLHKRFKKDLQHLIESINYDIMHPLGLKLSFSPEQYQFNKIGIIISKIHIHIDCENNSDHLIILPIYEYENK